jgi:hypothetical protein
MDEDEIIIESTINDISILDCDKTEPDTTRIRQKSQTNNSQVIRTILDIIIF